MTTKQKWVIGFLVLAVILTITISEKQSENSKKREFAGLNFYKVYFG